MPRRLSPDEHALWARVVESVKPIRVAASAAQPAEPLQEPERPPAPPPRRAPSVAAAPSQPPRRPQPGTTLDGSWDRKLGRGIVQPDMVLDLHGHNLGAAHALLDERLDRAIREGARVLLLITGKPPKGEPPVARGRIRSAVGDWLSASRHAGDIAAVRNAHPRHGGTGALYIVLRRRK